MLLFYAAEAMGSVRCVVPAVTPVGAHSVAETNGWDYLVPKVCSTRSDVPVVGDPCLCGSGSAPRPLAPTDLLTYHKVDQNHAQRHDSYLMRSVSGDQLVVSPFDFREYGRFEPWEGYTVLQVKKGWVSSAGTRDGTGFSTTFFGRDCQPSNGWVFFPLSAVTSLEATTGQVRMPIAGDYWEQNGESWPGVCPEHFNTDTLTTWEWVQGFEFGGSKSVETKIIDAIRVVHGFSTKPLFREKGHLEIFYFTRVYGITRWEVWTAATQARTPDAHLNCTGAAEMRYQGISFIRTSCRDWSAVELPAEPESHSIWPIPQLNLIGNFHFADGDKSWHVHKETGLVASPVQFLHSSSSGDHLNPNHSRGALTFTRLTCQSQCDGSVAIYQDIDSKRNQLGNGLFDFAATVRSFNGTTVVRLQLMQLDKFENTVSMDEFVEEVADHSVKSSAGESLLKSATFMAGQATITFRPETVALRLVIAPLSAGSIDIFDAWVMRH